MMLGGESENIAHALDALGLEEKRFQVIRGGLGVIIRLLLLDGAVVVHKGESLFVLGVTVAGGSRVAGT